MAAVVSNAISNSRLVKDLKAMGIVEGDHLGIAVSFKSIGRLDGGPDRFLDALVQTVGPEGTIMANTFTSVFGLSRLKTGQVHEIFVPSSTPANTGIVPEKLRKRKGALRSRHPTNSVAAVGKLARYLTQGHDHRSSGFAPYSRLAEAGGKILAVGIGDKLAGFRHEAQYLAGLLTVVPWKLGARYVDEQGTVKILTLRDPSGCTKRLHELVPPLREMGILTDGRIGSANAILAPARESLKIMTEMLKRKPARNLCANVSCLWCRELERRLDLYHDIADRRWFQRNLFAIALIATANWFRLGGNPLIISLRQLANTLDVPPLAISLLIKRFKHRQASR